MVGEAYGYVQGESLKPYAALLRRLLNSPITRLEGGPVGTQRAPVEHTLIAVRIFALALMMGYFLSGTSIAQTDPYASEQSHVRRSQYQSQLAEFLDSVRVIYFAGSCQVFLSQVDRDMLYKSKENEFADTMETYGVTTSGAFISSIKAAAKEGVDRAKQPAACKFWHDHPEVVDELRREAQIAEEE
jgi:hypothetical protein